MFRALFRLNDSTEGVMTLSGKTKPEFVLKITLEPRTADAHSVAIITPLLCGTQL